MLYDPKWEKPIITRANPRSLEALIAWLETKPRRMTYCYTDHGRCLAAQYCEHIGDEYYVAGFDPDVTVGSPFPKVLEYIACEGASTFGAALKRARALAAR